MQTHCLEVRQWLDRNASSMHLGKICSFVEVQPLHRFGNSPQAWIVIYDDLVQQRQLFNILYILRKPMRQILVLTLLTLALQFEISSHMDNLCLNQQSRKYIDISGARIQKITTFEYLLELYDSPVAILHNKSEIIFRGNFSKLILKNCALKKEFVYYGTEMRLKIPADHVFSMQNIPDLELQIVHAAAEVTRANPFHFVMFSQLYMVSKFTNKIQTTLSKYFSPLASNGDIIQTNKIVRIIEGFPMLMYKGSAESFPCRSDLLCLLKREYQLISQEDFEEVRNLLFSDGEVLPKMKAVKRKSLYEIQQIKRKEQDTQKQSNEL